MSNPLIIVQARMGSTRLPGKVMMPLHGHPLIEHVVMACTETEIRTVVAMPLSKGNEALRDYLEESDVEWDMAAEEHDVLGRFVAVATPKTQHDVIVRITADCPLIDHRTITELVDLRDALDLPYVGRCNDPDGNDVEVFTREMLLRANTECEPYQREHVTTWIRQQKNAQPSPSGKDLKDVKYSVDTMRDLMVCKQLLRACGEGSTWHQFVSAFRALKVIECTE